MSQAILFSRCLGLNDSKAFGTHYANPKTGATELVDCLNITTTSDGAVERVAALVPVLTHTAPVTSISAGQRFVYQDAINTLEWNGTEVAAIGAVLTGPVAHTPIGVRVSAGNKVYKSSIAGAALSEAVRGDLNNLPDADKKPYFAQPAFKQAFECNGILYGINAADPRFLQHSEYGHFDVFAIGDAHIGHVAPILQAGAIPGVMICTHVDGVSVYTGRNMDDFVKKFYACRVIDGTLFSGFIGKTYTTKDGSHTYGHCHVFMCVDGVYIVTGEGELINLTAARTSQLDVLNGAYTPYLCATLQGAKYLAFGANVCVEYDFETNSVLVRNPVGVTAAAIWNNTNYYASGSTVAVMGTEVDADGSASLTLPFSDLGASGIKSLEALYFTGTIGGEVRFTATDQTGRFWSVTVEAIGTVSNYRIKTPRGMLGNHLSFTVDCVSGAFRMEELRAAFSASQRTR